MREYPHLLPKVFSFMYMGFKYEVISVPEYYGHDYGVDLTGNYLLTILTPEGTLQTTVNKHGTEVCGEYEMLNKELCERILDLIND